MNRQQKLSLNSDEYNGIFKKKELFEKRSNTSEINHNTTYHYNNANSGNNGMHKMEYKIEGIKVESTKKIDNVEIPKEIYDKLVQIKE